MLRQKNQVRYNPKLKRYKHNRVQHSRRQLKLFQLKRNIRSISPRRLHSSPELTSLYNMPGVEVVPMDTLISKMAEHMVKSVHTSPHVAAIAECDMSAVDRARKSLGEEFLRREGFKLTYMPFICEAVVKALQDFPAGKCIN